MAINKKIEDFNQKMKSLKEDALKYVISDETMSKVEKLQFISQNNLMEIEFSWCDPFEEKYLDDYLEQVIATPEFKKEWSKYTNVSNPKGNVISDDYFVNNDYQRHQVVDLADLASNVDKYNKKEDKIIIYTNRTTKDVYKITTQEFVDTIYDWVIKNNTIGFELDW